MSRHPVLPRTWACIRAAQAAEVRLRQAQEESFYALRQEERRREREARMERENPWGERGWGDFGPPEGPSPEAEVWHARVAEERAECARLDRERRAKAKAELDDALLRLSLATNHFPPEGWGSVRHLQAWEVPPCIDDVAESAPPPGFPPELWRAPGICVRPWAQEYVRAVAQVYGLARGAGGGLRIWDEMVLRPNGPSVKAYQAALERLERAKSACLQALKEADRVGYFA